MAAKRKGIDWAKFLAPASEPPVWSVASFYSLLPLALLSGLALLFHLIRIVFSEAVDFSLDWNLFLSWIPLLIAFLARNISKRYGPRPLVIALLSVGWLAFFPNAPYMVTDLIHLSIDEGSDRTWHDAIMLFYYAMVSLFNGLVSLYWMHGAWVRTYRPPTGLVMLLLSFPLAGLGVYLGRVLRLNSWDIFENPAETFHNLFSNIFDRTALLLIVEFGLLLGTLYAVLWGLLRYRLPRHRHHR